MKTFSGITWIHNIPSPYQIEFWNALVAHGVDVEVIHCAPGAANRPWKDVLKKSYEARVLRGVNLWPSPFREMYVNPGIVSEVLRSPRDRLWIVGGYTIPTVQAAMWLLSLRGVPWVLLNEAPKKDSLLRRIAWSLLLAPAKWRARGVLCYGSERMADFFRRSFPRSPVRACPQYEDISRYLAIPRPRPGLVANPRAVRFFFAGQLEPFTGMETAIRAFNDVAATDPDVTLEILGKGTQLAHLQGLVAPHARERVTFHGAVDWDRVPEFYARGDVFVHPSFGQGWGMVVNESLASGLPLVTTPTVGAAEYCLEDGVNGILIRDMHDVAGLAAAMRRFASDPEFLASASRAARDTAASMLDLGVGVPRFLDLLAELTGGRVLTKP